MPKSLDQNGRNDVTEGSPRGEETRQRIVTAAVEMVAEHGWDAVTTRQIAARARVNQALIHYHFGSKDHLLVTAFDVALRDMFAAPTAALLAAPTFAEGAVALIRALSNALDLAGPMGMFSMEAVARSVRDERLRVVMAELLAEFRRTVADRIETAQRSGELDVRLDPSAAATALAALFDGLGLHLLIDPRIDADRTAMAVAALLKPPPQQTAGGAHMEETP